MDNYHLAFVVLIIVCVLLVVISRSGLRSHVTNETFRCLQRCYLTVYLLAMAGDWLQGPHMYALYQSYHMSTQEINWLFVAGFGSSMILGTVVGPLADMYGRRANCILYGILYGCSCLTKHVPSFWVLLIGRVLGGAATSILFSAFESWLVCEYYQRKCDPSHLGVIFSNATLGSSVIAVFAGIVAQYVANRYGFVAPFDVSLVILLVMIVVIVMSWNENYGDNSGTVATSCGDAWIAIKSDPRVFYLGIIQSLFEGAMYTFVLEWTPALTPPIQDVQGVYSIPHGVIFGSFMVAVMIGSSIFKMLLKISKPQSFMRVVFLVGAAALSSPVLFPENRAVIFFGFIVFEICVGVFWPALGTLRGEYIPEKARATVMNYFRLPLNLLVICILIQDLSQAVIFQSCVIFLLLAFVSQHLLNRVDLSTSESLFAPSEGV